MATDLSTASTVSNDINYINEVIKTPEIPPIDLPDTIVIAQGFHAGTIDGATPGLAGLVGCGLTAAGFHGVNSNHKLDYFLSARSFDYSGSAFPELGLTEAGELRIGNDVSANGSGTLTGSSYLRYRPSTGLEIVGSNISVSSGNYVWVGTQFSNGVGLADGVGGPPSFSGIVATHADAITFLVDSATGNLTVGANSELTFDVATSTLKIGTSGQQLQYSTTTGLYLDGGGLNIGTNGYAWIGSTSNYSPDLSGTGVGIVNLGIVGVNSGASTFLLDATNGSLAVGPNSELSFDSSTNTLTIGTTDHNLTYSTSGLAITGGNITVDSGGYVWVGTQFTAGVGIADKVDVGNSLYSGIVASHAGEVTFLIDSVVGGFIFGKESTGTYIQYIPTSNILTIKNTNIVVTDGFIWTNATGPTSTSGIGLISTGLYAYDGTNQTVFIDANTGDFTFGSSASHQLTFDASEGLLQLDGANIGVANNSYVWVGDTDLNNGIGLAGGITGFTDGLYARNGGSTTAFINATNGQFTFGPTSGANLNYDGTTLTLSKANVIVTDGFVWTNTSGPTSNAGIGLISSGLYAYDGAAQTVKILSADGTFQFGPTGKNIKYDGSNLSITGSNLVLSSGNYVWVGTPTTNGVGFSDAGLLATTGGTTTAYIDASDGSFQFGKSSGSYIKLDSSGNFSYHFNNWATDVGGSNVPAANADVTADNNQSISWLDEASGTTILVGNTEAKCTDPYADRTSTHTAYNTNYVNGSTTTSSYTYDVLGDLRIMNGKDIEFYTGDGSGKVGGIYANTTKGLAVEADTYLTLICGGGSYRIVSDGTIIPGATYSLGDIYNKWYYVLANYIGVSGHPITTAEITTVNATTLNASSNTVTEQITCQRNKVYLGGTSFDSSMFHLHLWNDSDGSYIGHFQGYITSN